MAQTVDCEVLTIAQFCQRNGISLTLFHKLKAQGRGPRVMRLGRAHRITLAAEKDWRAEREQPSDAEQRLLQREEAARRRKARAAAQASVASPRHVSKRGRGDAKG
jgi:hypothetical protein